MSRRNFASRGVAAIGLLTVSSLAAGQAYNSPGPAGYLPESNPFNEPGYEQGYGRAESRTYEGYVVEPGGYAQQMPAQGQRHAQQPPAQAEARGGYGAQTYQSLGRRSMAEGNVRGAEQRFAEALEINPFDPVALNNLAAAKAEQGDYHTAMELLERAERLAPQNADIAANLARLRGWLNYYAGNDIHPAARIAVPEARMTEGLPPPPPALWEPAQARPRIVLPPSDRTEGYIPPPGGQYR